MRSLTACCCLLAFALTPALAENKVLGELELDGATKVEKTSGVWIDGQYLGYLDELKGSKKILLLPGTHKVSVRQDGYQEFTTDITLQPGQKEILPVRMEKDTRYVMPAVKAEVKISVNPDRAAVFLDGQFIGHAAEFGKGLMVAPGHRKISISLPGYQTFTTDVDLAPNQKFQIKTDLLKSGSPQMTVPEQ